MKPLISTLWHPRSRLRRNWIKWQVTTLRLLGIRHLKRGSVSEIELDVGRFPYMGFGASIGWIGAAYIARERLSAQLSILNPDRWPFGGENAAADLTRFIDFPDATIRYGLASGEALPMALGEWADLSKWGYHDALDTPYCLFGYKPAGFADLDAYRSATLRHMYRLSAFSREQVDRGLAFVPERYVAWHVRRGDKTAGRWREDHPVSIDAYLKATREVLDSSAASVDAVVLCTDSDAIVDEARQRLRQELPGIELVADPDEKRWNGFCALQRTGQIDQVADIVAEVLTAQKVLEILRGADFLIGCNSSCLFRTAALLRPDLTRVTSLSENKIWKKYYPI